MVNQLTMHLEGGGSPLRESLSRGEFSLLVEFDAPAAEMPFELAMKTGVSVAARARQLDVFTGFLVNDRPGIEACHDVARVAATLRRVGELSVAVTLSGTGRDEESFRSDAAAARAEGAEAVLLVTGDRSPCHPQPRGHRWPAYRRGYLDSVRMLAMMRGMDEPLFAGAAMNPFKYTVASLHGQYYKMARKVAEGAGFLVAQVGWDMRKLQELQWYMQMREFAVPVLARLALLSPTEVSSVHRGYLPGVVVSRSFGAALQRESNVNAEQSLAAQLHRLELQVAGCRLMGFSGAIVRGVQDARILDLVARRATEALAQYPTFAAWLAAWQDFHAGLASAPIEPAYYVFREGLNPERVRYDEAHCRQVDAPFPAPSARDWLRAGAMRFLLAGGNAQGASGALAGLVCGCCRERAAELAHCEYLCPSACPKRLALGPCGGSYPDGTCEFGHAPCFFARVLAVAARRRELDALEEAVTL